MCEFSPLGFLFAQLSRAAGAWRRSMIARLLALMFASLALHHPAAQAQDQPAHSLRVATYNAYLLSPLFKCLPPGPLILDCLAQITNQTEAWANRLADTILADPDRFDIIVLNEVWDEDAKEILVKRLRGQYPVYVKKLDASLVQIRAQLIDGLPLVNGVKLNGEDSGLMLFARRGFTALALPSTRHRWGGAKGTLQASTKHVAFRMFQDFASDDGYAAKGVGFIRLRHDASRTIYNVAFTHLQADYPDKNEFYPDTRKKQFSDVKRVIEQTLAPLGSLENLLKLERLIVAGDLNVAVIKHGKDEWRDLFNTAGSFFTRPLYDAWRASSPDVSLGVTNEVDGDRLDYVLASVDPYRSDLPGRQLNCVQHSTVPVDFKALESDHFMVHADMNRGFWHCHPRIAYKVKTSELSGNVAIDKHPGNPNLDITRIAYPGSMQWFYVEADGPGTYTIGRFGQGSPGGPVSIDIYAPEDLTTPISRYNKTTVALPFGAGMGHFDQFVLPKAYYIRIKGPNRSWTGNYALQIRRHTCATREMACILQPGMPQTARLTGQGEQNTVGQIQNEAWFRFHVTGQSDAGEAQIIELAASGLPAGPGHTANLVDYANPGGLPPLAGPVTPDGLKLNGKANDGAGGYLLLKQPAPGPQGATITASFETSLRLLEFNNLICADETNPELGSDEIYSRFNIDGSWFRYPASGHVSFDCDNTRHSRNWAAQVGRSTITYVDKVRIRVLELDDTSADDPSRERDVPALGPQQTKREGVLKWNFSDGKYEFPYAVRKRANAPVAEP